MGEIAEGLINGDFDFHTGEYLGRGGGFPRSLQGFGKRNKRPKQEHYTDRQKMNGILNWLYGKGYKNAESGCDVIRMYVDWHGWVIGKKSFIMRACLKISEDFPAFIKWFGDERKRFS